MGDKSYRSCGALVALCTALIPSAAVAQTVSADRIEAIERQMRNLQSDLQQLKNELGEAKQQLRQSRGETHRAKEEARQAQQAAEQARQNAARAATAESQATQAATQARAAAAAALPAPVAAADGVKVGFPGGRPTISSSDGRMSFAIGNQTQFDYGGYNQNPDPATQFPHLNNGVNLRRERIYFVARYDDFSLNVTPDFGGSPDGALTNQTLYEANLNFTGFKPVTATVGYFKPWFSLYDDESSNDFLLMERPSIIEIARNVAAGDARATFPSLKASTDRYFAAWALTGAPFGAQTSNLLNGEQLGTVGRIAGRPYYDEDWNFHLDFSGEYVFHPNNNAHARGQPEDANLSGSPRIADRHEPADQHRKSVEPDRQCLWRGGGNKLAQSSASGWVLSDR
jgi:phosphate-selective porin OprO and OprP